ncbi:hypothetical protein [Actinomadura sp. 6N118]|uniref:hypothetical protein n=1 Tax=Actinomadura sp. 6N118 TaxID=3375151 RepID=UPI00378DA755
MTERETVHDVTDALEPKRKPIDALPLVLDAFEESARERIHERIAEVVRLFVYQEAALRLRGDHPMAATLALRHALGTVRPLLDRYLKQHGILPATSAELIRGTEKRVHYLTTSGPEADLPPDARDFPPPQPREAKQ